MHVDVGICTLAITPVQRRLLSIEFLSAVTGARSLASR